jgi:hypothetical protein
MALHHVTEQPGLQHPVNVGPITIAVLEVERNALAQSTLGLANEMPHKTLAFQLLAILVAYINTKQPKSLVGYAEVLDQFARNLASISEVLQGIVSQVKAKVFSMLLSQQTIASIIGQVGTASSLALNERQLTTLLHHAIPGSAPAESQAEALEAVTNLLRITESVQALAVDAPLTEHHVVLAFANLCARFTKLVEAHTYNPIITTIGAEKDQSAQRIATFRAETAYFAGALSAGKHQIALHLLNWLNSPLVTHVMAMQTRAALTPLTEIYRKEADAWPYSERGCYTNQLEAALLRDTKIGAAGRKPGLTDLTAALLGGDKTGLEGDFTVGLAVERPEVDAWVQIAYDLMDDARATCAAISSLKAAGVDVTTGHEPAPLEAPKVSGLREMTGLPNNPTTRATIITWPSRRRLWAQKLDPTRLHTLAAVRQGFTAFTPVYVYANAYSVDQRDVFLATPKAIPVFGGLEDGHPTFTTDKDGFERVTNWPAVYIQKRCAELGREGANSMMARGFAESLRYIGRVSIQVEGGEPIVVQPLSCHFYHGSKFTQECFREPFELARWTQSPEQGGRVGVIRFEAFRFVPMSAELAKLPSRLSAVKTTSGQLLPTQSLMRWIDGEESAPSSVEITGWCSPEHEIADLVLIAEAPAGERYRVFTDEQNHGRVAAAPYNAVVSLLTPPTPEPWQGTFHLSWNSTLSNV